MQDNEQGGGGIPIEPGATVKVTDSMADTKIVLDELIKAHKQSAQKSRERSLVITKLEEARLWLNECE